MKIYLAIVPQTLINNVISDMEYPNILNSFAYKKAIDTLTYKPTEFTLDSGAFTAWNVGKEVDIEQYKAWSQQMSIEYPNVRCVNLDVIPGEVGRTSTAAERIAGMKISLDNADNLRDAGLNVMEVFHQDEPFDYLDLLISRLPSRESVLCISPRNDVSNKAKLIWHKQVLKHLVDTVGKENLPRMHGLAVTAKSLILEFPYFSADSSSYAAPVRFGRVSDYDGKMITIEEFLGHNHRNDKYSGVSIVIRRMIDEYIRLEQQTTSIWASRGIVWE